MAIALVGAGLSPALADVTVSSSQTQNGGQLIVSPAGVLVISDPVNDPLLTLTNSATTGGVQALVVGSLAGEKGQLRLEGGSVLTNSGTGALGTFGDSAVSGGQAYLGLNSGASGSAIIAGNGSAWNNTNTTYVGYNGTGSATVQAGGKITTSNGGLFVIGQNNSSSGTVLISGAGSTVETEGRPETNPEIGGYVSATGYAVIGNYSTGSLTIENGGKLVNTVAPSTVSVIGSSASATLGIGTGTAKVTGTGSKWETTGGLTVANSGNGTLTVEDGGSVSSLRGVIGGGNNNVQGGDGKVTISGEGSKWEITATSSNALRLGVNTLSSQTGRAKALLTIENGGTLTTQSFSTIGASDGTTADVIVTGAGSKWLSTGNIQIAASASATPSANTATASLTIKDGGLVSTTGTTHILGANGKLKLQGGGTLETAGLVVGNGTFDFTGGTLKLGGGNFGGISAVPVAGTVAGEGTFQSSLLNAGTLAPGNSPGAVNVLGDLTNTGNIDLEIASLSNFDTLNITGAFVAGGTIKVALTDGYVPLLESSFDLVNFGSFVANGYTFDFGDAVLPAGRSWDTSNFSVDGSIVVIPEPAALSAIAMIGVALLGRGRRRDRIV